MILVFIRSASIGSSFIIIIHIFVESSSNASIVSRVTIKKIGINLLSSKGVTRRGRLPWWSTKLILHLNLISINGQSRNRNREIEKDFYLDKDDGDI